MAPRRDQHETVGAERQDLQRAGVHRPGHQADLADAYRDRQRRGSAILRRSSYAVEERISMSKLLREPSSLDQVGDD